MQRKKRLSLFLAKSALFLALLILPVYLLGLIPGMQAVTDPRKFLFNQDDFTGYQYAIIGDSVFCSYNVNSLQETMWQQFEARTGRSCFPAALNGATIADMIDAADYLGQRLPSGSTVFVGLIPTRFVGKGGVRHRNYYQDFDQLKQRLHTSLISRSLKAVINISFNPLLIYREPYSLEKFLRKKKSDFKTGYKSWHDTGRDVALRNFLNFVDSQKEREVIIDTVALDQIRSGLAVHGSKAVFVLSALNQGLVREFSSPEEAERLLAKFRDARDQLVAYCERTGSNYIDLFDKIESDCFADLVHINSCGDAVMAQAFADYVSSVK